MYLVYIIIKARGDSEVDTESEHSYYSATDHRFANGSETNDSLFDEPRGALDFGDSINKKRRVLFDRRFAHEPRYTRWAEEIRRHHREMRGAETVSLFRRVYMT